MEDGPEGKPPPHRPGSVSLGSGTQERQWNQADEDERPESEWREGQGTEEPRKQARSEPGPTTSRRESVHRP